MDIKQLNYFKTIVEQGGISAAARALNLAQPVLSRALQALESEVGEALLVRRRSGTELTAPGERFYQKIKKLIAAYDSIVDNPFDHTQEKIGLINYGRTKYWTSWPLAAFHDAVHESNGLDVDSAIIVAADQGFASLMDGDIDILLTQDKRWADEKIDLLFEGQFQWGFYLNERVHQPGPLLDPRLLPWLAWADKHDFLFHQLEASFPQLNVKYMGGYEDLMGQNNGRRGVILPTGLKLEPEGYSLRATLPMPLHLLVYVRRDRYEPTLTQALRKGLEARW